VIKGGHSKNTVGKITRNTSLIPLYPNSLYPLYRTYRQYAPAIKMLSASTFSRQETPKPFT